MMDILQTTVAIYAIGFLVAVFGGIPFVRVVLACFKPIRAGNAKGAGKVIGIFERAIIVTTSSTKR